MIYKKTKRLYFIFLSIIIFLLDQVIKYLISLNYYNFINKDYLLFSIDFVRNYGAAFNIFSGSRIFLSIVSFIFSIILLSLILRKKNLKSIELFGYSFILGGSLGNGIDRILRGYVIDFINLSFIDFPIFNIADISINVGFLLIFYSLFKNKHE